MDTTHINIKFRGTGFSPKKLAALTGLPIKILQEIGEIAKRGPEKGKPSSKGSGTIQINTHDNSDKELNLYLDILINKKDILVDTGLEKIVIDIEVPSNQFNSISLSPDLISKIYNLQASVVFSNYQNDIAEISKVEPREKIIEELIFKHYRIQTKAHKIPSNDLILQSFHQLYQDKSSKEIHTLVEQVAVKASAFMGVMLIIGFVAGLEKDEKKIESGLKNIFLNE